MIKCFNFLMVFCFFVSPLVAQTRADLMTAAQGLAALKTMSDVKYSTANGAAASVSTQANAVLPQYNAHELATPGYTVDPLYRTNWTALLNNWNIKKVNFAIDSGFAKSTVSNAMGQVNFMQIYGMMPMTQQQINDQMNKIDAAVDAIGDLDVLSDAFLVSASMTSYNAAKYARLENDDYQAYLYAHSWWPHLPF